MPRTSASITLRPAAAEDCASLAALSIEVWLTTYLREGISQAFADYVLRHYTPDRFAAALSSDGECLLVSQNGDGIDGYIRLAHNRPSPAGGASRTEISTLYVRPCAQGTHIGASLLRAGLEAGASRGWEAPWLAANSENKRAIAFYLRHGFERAGLTWFQLQDGNYPNDVLQYRGAWQAAKT
ncbi:GNAT family N-acetyltransferase [Leisingera caerulea]|uniref:GNAT family N-acetyltransferase n=1 Tax=Leisingera caerulea TaxID=506591 RepID=UPI0003F8FEE2|nr:N-acetyltransferase [Leisingera caerulea]